MVNEYKNSPSYHMLFPMGEFILVIAKRWAGSQQSSICFLGEKIEREKNSRLSEQQTHSLVIPTEMCSLTSVPALKSICVSRVMTLLLIHSSSHQDWWLEFFIIKKKTFKKMHQLPDAVEIYPQIKNNHNCRLTGRFKYPGPKKTGMNNFGDCWAMHL